MPQISFTFDIPQGEGQNFTDYFLAAYPIPMNDAGEPAYTPTVWIRRRVRQLIFEAARAGKKILDSQVITELDENYLT